MNFFNWCREALKGQRVIEFPAEGYSAISGMKNSDDPFKRSFFQFIQKVAPTERDAAIRQLFLDDIISRIAGIVEERAPNHKFILAPCGSSLNGTFIPESDIDIALFFYPKTPDPKTIVNALFKGMKDILIPDSFKPILQASVPLVKFEIDPGIQVDLSIDELHGPLNVESIRQYQKMHPYVLPIHLFVKCLLFLKQLDSPYTGGLSSYTVLCMIVAFLQNKGPFEDVIDALTGFLDFYGNEFNYILVGIDMKEGGQFFSRYKTGTVSWQSPATLLIKDPLNFENKLGHNSFSLQEIREAFQESHNLIVTGQGVKLLAQFDTLLELLDSKKMIIDEHLLNQSP